jgi:serine/threonine protein kinase
MSPEQVRGNNLLTGPSSDVYSMGVILYQILTGRIPFTGGSVMEVYEKILEGHPVPPRTVNGGIPHDIEVICLKAMAKQPHRRYPTAQAFADDLGRFRLGEPILARPASPPWRLLRRLRRWLNRRRSAD